MDRQKIEDFITEKNIKCPQCGHDKFDIKVHAKSILSLNEDQKEIMGAGDKIGRASGSTTRDHW